MEGLVVGAVLVPVVLAAVIIAVRQLSAIQIEVVQKTAEVIWGPRQLDQPGPVAQPDPEPSMFPAWEEEPWSMETSEPPPPEDSMS